MDPYLLLNIKRDATLPEIKAAYHRALREHHPDKVAGSTADLAAIQHAYRVLTKETTSPRPAQVVSLDEFEETNDVFTHPCRCSGSYSITEADMEAGTHLVSCSTCSEVIWVGYQLI
ncbi:hypothetical protein FB45DRAFT_734923 [Roridomyces roridus]|uniref:Diphthamide biosynthesis protein 4 n=1 Tax=Roridomyces roridus TaxID=1738132 RepID=A0AAD7CG10_9AGAR|nr:hypothetical protein FB45DRAFT_734923 [Roridomyces roridus]